MAASEDKLFFKAYGYEWPLFVEADRCIWCGLPWRGDLDSRFSKTREHIVPKSFTPERGAERISASHAVCNSKRQRNLEWVPYTVDDKSKPESQRQWIPRVQKLMQAQRKAKKKERG